MIAFGVRQGGRGTGGGAAAGRHRSAPSGTGRAEPISVGCTTCGRTLTTTLVFHAGRLYCSSGCVSSAEMAVPGLFLG
jgi:hypothetical protein